MRSALSYNCLTDGKPVLDNSHQKKGPIFAGLAWMYNRNETGGSKTMAQSRMVIGSGFGSRNILGPPLAAALVFPVMAGAQAPSQPAPPPANPAPQTAPSAPRQDPTPATQQPAPAQTSPSDSKQSQSKDAKKKDD